MNYSPSFSAKYPANLRLANGKQVRDFLLAKNTINRTDGGDVFSGKLRLPSASSFSDFIGYVLAHCPKPKMVRIAAWRIVAGMTDMFSFWNRSIVNNPRNPMGKLSSIRFCSFFNFSIPSNKSSSRPFPAFVVGRFRYVLPKAINYCFRKSNISEVGYIFHITKIA